MKNRIVIIGSGIAGLSLATKLNEGQADLDIVIVTKAAAGECNTRYAQGGIAAVMNNLEDTFEEHVRDTLISGKGLCDGAVVDMVVRQAPDRIKELVQWGIRFDKTSIDSYDLALEGGHAHPRVIHHKDMTGFEIETALLSRIKQSHNISLLDYHSALDLITENRQGIPTCVGVNVLDWNDKLLKSISASKVILASGGCGQVYLNTTNPSVATGDGYAIAGRAGAALRDLRFMQFHPTALYKEVKKSVSFLISEALRGFGAYIVDKRGQRFLYTYDALGELATRDIVSSAIIDHQNKTGEKYVYLDLRHLDMSEFEKRFPCIAKELKLEGYDPSLNLIPIVPSAHYQCGGVKVNQHGETTIKNLYAIGEVASTGLHGANRLASNSLLEALVYVHNASKDILHEVIDEMVEGKLEIHESPLLNDVSDLNFKELEQEIKTKMSSVAFCNQKESIQKKRDLIFKLVVKADELIQKKVYSQEILNFRNLACTARFILDDKLAAIQQKTSHHIHN